MNIPASDKSQNEPAASVQRGPANWPPQDVGVFGMYMLLVSLGMLFAASIVGYIAIRSMHQPWPPPGFPALPRSLWLSTVVILFSSITIQHALKAARRDDLRAIKRNMTLTLLLGMAFLGLQTFAWLQIVRQIDVPAQSMGPYLKLFFVLTGLHAAHVLGGLATLGFATRSAFAGRYGATDHAGVRYAAMYWHFLAAVWYVLFIVLYVL